MGKLSNTNINFKEVILLIEEARSNAFHKVNEELVLLNFKVGKLVSEKVSTGIWGENTVEALATFIQEKCPGLKGFNRRGLYRMKQFYETYTAPEFVSPLATQLHDYETKLIPKPILANKLHQLVEQLSQGEL
jgi:hypothetical protein